MPDKIHLRHALILLFHLEKTAAESRRMLVETYGDHALSASECTEWFRRFKSGDFDVTKDEPVVRMKKITETDLQALLDKDDTQSQKMLAQQLNVSCAAIARLLKAMGKTKTAGQWVQQELNETQLEARKSTCESLIKRHNEQSFCLDDIVIGGEKWIYYENPKRKKTDQPSASTSGSDPFGMRIRLCFWWDRRGVIHYEFLKPNQVASADRRRQQMLDLNQAMLKQRPESEEKNKTILLHDNGPLIAAEPFKKILESLEWDILPHQPYSPDLAPSYYHVFLSMGYELAEQQFKSLQEIEKWVDEWFSSQGQPFFERGIHRLPERWQKCIDNDGHYIE